MCAFLVSEKGKNEGSTKCEDNLKITAEENPTTILKVAMGHKYDLEMQLTVSINQMCLFPQ